MHFFHLQQLGRLVGSALLIFTTSLILRSQSACSGTVVANNGETLAFVSVIAEADSHTVGFTDVEGRFSVIAKGPIQTLTFRYVGFQEKTLNAADLKGSAAQNLKIILLPSDNSLSGVDIIAGENPADIIIRKAIANRHQNNPEWKGSYRCETYNKINFEPLFDRKTFEEKKTSPESAAQFNRMQEMFNRQHLFLMESVTERTWQAPNQLQERVVLNRVSGFKNAEIVALANAVQPFSFYGDYLPVLDKKFVNPISPGSTKRYFFELKDTLYDGADTIWVIAFKPRKGKIFMALQGVVHIHSNQYAVQHVMAHPAFGNENLDMMIEQAYRFMPASDSVPDGHWFPEQLNFEIHAARYPEPGIGLGARGLSYIAKVQVNPRLRARDFNVEQPLLIEKNASSRDTTRWLPWRTSIPLSNKEMNTYTFMDSLGNAKNYDRLSKVLGVLSTGVWPVKNDIGIHINSLLQFNNFENTRLGIRFTNAQYRPLGQKRRLEWGLGAGYGISDKKFKENGYLLWRIHRAMQTQLRLDIKNDLAEPGTTYELNPTAYFNRSLYATRMDYVREYALKFSSRISRSFSVSVAARHQELRPGYAYNFIISDNTPPATRFTFDEATLFLRLAYGEQTHEFLGSNALVQRLPVLEVAGTMGKGTVAYSRLVAAVHQSVFVRRLGYFQWRLEGGWASSTAPISKLFTLNQAGGGFNTFVVSQTFQSLPDTLFLHNRYANLYLSQEIGPVLYQHQRSAPFLSLIQNVAWGSLSRPELHQGIGFLSVKEPFLETGIKLDNLLRFNYLNVGWIGVGAAVFYRWGFLHDAYEPANFTPRLSLKLSL